MFQFHYLLILSWLGGSRRAHAGGVEYEGSHFCFGALGGDFFSIPEETYAGGVPGFHHDLAAGAHGRVRGSNESLLADGLTVGEDGDPGVL